MKSNSIKYLLVLLVSAECSYSQSLPNDNKTGNNLLGDYKEESSVSGFNMRNTSKEKQVKNERIEKFDINFRSTITKRGYSFDLISSIGSNISFGGFWDQYAVINFTPQVFIRPLNSVSIYASHSLNCLIPVNGIGDYSKTILLESAVILAFDNSMKYIMNNNSHWITETLAFAAKTILINLLVKTSINKSSESPIPMLKYENYYYSVSIAF